ncbi:Methyl-accepting chemotaxis protein PctB [Roseimaritima multifibrata]|uniref:Methyl-accepting chemotaxis protein PctB n=1 Tax=Roseimaritima multifibrata TaxID=1930274 RepID=A0A517MEA0_9BACT|nr:methyl-accepting chemotaxis protein [Roseimaritima multifibrata]QDS93211.1 Methyl-accepting chemotaxis protein PctB [Roseimaritima multifibrata]
MRIISKLLLATALPAILVWSVGIYASRVSQASLRDVLEDNSTDRAREVMDEIDWIIQTRTTTWQAYLSSQHVVSLLHSSNEEFSKEPNVQAMIAARDRQWQMGGEEETKWIKQITNNELSQDLRAWLGRLESVAGYPVFGEVFLTNRYGANVAQTARTSDYRQDDEAWWSQAVRDEVVVGAVDYDESARLYSIDICISVVGERGELLGVLKAVMNIRELLQVADVTRGKQSLGGRLMLFDREQRIMSGNMDGSTPLPDGSPYLKKLRWKPGQTERFERHVDPSNGNVWVAAFARSRNQAGRPNMGWIVMDAQQEAKVFAPVWKMRKQIVWFASFVTLVVIGIGWWIARSIRRPIQDLLDGTERIIEGDFEHPIVVSKIRELGRLGTAFNRMSAGLKSNLAARSEQEALLKQQFERLKKQSLTLASQEELLAAQKEREHLFDAIRNAAERVKVASENILATTSNQARGSQEQAAAISETASTMQQVAQIASQTADRADYMLREAEHAAAGGERGRQALAKSTAAIGALKHQIAGTAAVIVSLAERATAIGQITSTVRQIAEQTNILALNAAVEASRAGEHGKGFAVVAAEVKGLAQQSKESTKQVRQILAEIQQATSASVSSIEAGTLAVQQANLVAEETQVCIHQLLDTISDSAQTATKISQSATQQAVGVGQLNEVLHGMETVASENAVSLQEINQAVLDLNRLGGELTALTTENGDAFRPVEGSL